MHLDAFFGHQRADAPDAELGGRQRALACHAVARVDGGCGVDDGRAGLFDLQQQVGHAVLQRLETADENAELLARAQVLQRGGLGGFHRAQRFGAQRQHAAADGAFQRGVALAFGAQQRVGAQRHAVEREFGDTAAVDGGAAAHREAGGFCGHEEQRNAGFVVHVARGAGGDQEQVGLLALRHHGLGAVQHPAVAMALGLGLYPRAFVMRVGLVVREGRHAHAVDDVAKLGFLGLGAGGAERLADHHRAQQRLDHEAAAQRLEDHGNVEAAAAEAAVGLAEQRADHAQFGELLERFLAEPVRRLRDAVARVERVLLGDEAVQAVGEHAPVFGVFEVHCMSPYRPRIILLMMFFWISLEPPKIDSLRLLK